MLIVEEQPKSIYAEAFRTIKTNIKYSSADKNRKVFLVTSTNPGDGKSTVAANLALSLSLDNKKVILLDCDLRKPSIHRNFRISGFNGLTEILIGEKEVLELVYKHTENLDVLTAGTIPPNPAELLSSDAMGDLLNSLKEVYDYVIVDAPPLGIVADSQIISAKVDGTILVVKPGKTKKEKLVECKKILDQVEGKIMGVVMNCVKGEKHSYYYY